MLPAEYRLKRKINFDKVVKQGKKFFSSLFIARVDKKFQGAARVGIIISSKIAKKAVVRNRLKRWISNDINNHLDLLLPADYVLIPKKHISEKKHKEISKDIELLLKKVKRAFD